jgi:hypothetical protein
LDDGTAVGTRIYPADSNRLSDVTQGAATVRSFTHDAAGNITHDDRAGTVYRYRYLYLYNDRGRLMQFRIDNQPVLRAHRGALLCRMAMKQTEWRITLR